jgi:hypothetical protein
MIRPGARRGAVLEIAGRPLCPVYDIVNERFPGSDPTKWDFSLFERSADAAPSKKRKRTTRDAADESDEGGGRVRAGRVRLRQLRPIEVRRGRRDRLARRGSLLSSD